MRIARWGFSWAAAILLGFGASAPRHHSNCHSIYGIATVCIASAASPAKSFGLAWERGMNLYGRQHKQPYRIKHIRCSPYGEAFFKCRFSVVDVMVNPNRVVCESATLTNTGAVWDGSVKIVPCAGGQTGPPSA